MGQVGPAPKGPVPVELTAGPFVGVRDAVELAAQDVNRASAMVNCFIPIPEIGTDVMQRAGFTQRTVQSVSGLPTSPQPLRNFTIDAPIYWLASFTDASGVNWNLAVCKVTPLSGWVAQGRGEAFFDGATLYATLVRWTPDGETYSYAGYDPAADVGAQLDTFNVANKCYFQQFANFLICVDGANRPLKWNSADVGTTTPTLTTLTDLAVATYGPPAVYYGKLFFILGSDRTTMVWSEENDPDIGYQATGYDNFWTLRQTSSAPMSALAGTNEALYVFRTNSITAIQGAVNSDFRASGTLEGISQSIGTLSPDTVTIAEDAVWFLDQFARPYKIQAGRGLVPLWPNCIRTCNTADLTAATQLRNWGRYIPETETVIFRVAQQTGDPKLLAFNARTEEFIGEWSVSGYTGMQTAELFFDSTGRSTLAVNKTSADLSFVWQKANTTTDQRDVLATTAAPTMSVTTPRLLGDVDTSITVSELTVTSQRLNDQQSDLFAQWRTSASGTYTTAAEGTDTVVGDGNPSRFVWQPNSTSGRWVQVNISNDTADNARATIGQVRVGGTQQRADWTTA
jgi:hypothetical protein